MKKLTQGHRLHSILLLAMLLFAYMVLGQSGEYNPSEKRTYRNSTLGKSFDVEYKGKITLTDNDKDVKSISPGGFLEISKTSFGNRRYILIEAESGGKLYREYREGRTKVDWEPDGADWLAEILPELVRTTTLAADTRIERFYKKGGVNAVLAEIPELESDYVQSKYFSIFLDMYDLKASDLAKVAETAGEEVGSDYYLAEVLKNHGALFFASDQATDAYLKAAGKIGSDYYMAVVLKEAMEDNELSESQMALLLKSTSNIESDYYVTTVLKEALNQRNLNSTRLKAIVDQSRNISSDHYQTELLKEVIENNQLEGETIEIIIDAISSVGSDYYTYSILIEILDKDNLSESATLGIAKRVMEEISSDHYASEVLSKLSRKDLSDEGFKKLIEASEQINSDFYNSKLLSQISERTLTENQLLLVLEGARNINSDFYLSEILVDLADQVRDASSRVKDAYRDAADEINSQTYYGKVMKALRD